MLYHINKNIDYDTIIEEGLNKNGYESFIDPKDGSIVEEWNCLLYTSPSPRDS